MVEPFTTVIFNTLLSPRSTLKCPSSLSSVAKISKHSSSRRFIGSDFFSPRPRHVKGKDKADTIGDDPYRLLQCQEWSNNLSRNALWCPHQCRFMLAELLQGQKKPPRCYKSHPPLNRLSLSPSFVNQRRHSSKSSNDPPTSIAPPPDEAASQTSPFTLTPEAQEMILRLEKISQTPTLEAQEMILRLEKISQTPRRDIDMDRIWRLYGTTEGHFIPTRTKLAFIDKYLSTAEMHYTHWKPQAKFQLWGERARDMLQPLAREIAPQSRLDQWRMCLDSRMLALLGDAENAILTIHEADAMPLTDAQKAGIPYAYEMIMRSLAERSSNASVIELAAREWPTISLFIQQPLDLPPALERSSRSMRKFLFPIVLQVLDPTPFLEREAESDSWREAIGNLFLKAFSLSQRGQEAYNVFLKMQKLGFRVPRPFQYSLIKALAQSTFTMQHAKELMASIPPGDRQTVPYLQLALFVSARQGDPAAAESYYNRLAEVGKATSDDSEALVQSYTSRDPLQVEEVFNRFFPLDSDGKRANSPTLYHYAPVLNAYARRGDQHGITRWMQDLIRAGLVPDVQIYTIILDSIAYSGNKFFSVKEFLQDMRDQGVRPNAVTYTIGISILAYRKDPLGAEALFKRAVTEGVIPDSRMVNAIMNAHAETGSWKGVIRTYDYLVVHGFHSLNADTYNTLLKAYVLIGAPFAVVSKFFQRLLKTNVRPTMYTYALLIQSACDAGLMETATDIYYDLQDIRAAEPERGLEMNVYIMTILLAGFLRYGDKVRARKVYEEMCNQGIQPTAITFATIIKAYANEKSLESLRTAEEFIKTQIDLEEMNRLKPKYDFNSPIHRLFNPIIATYGKLEKPEEAERVYQEVIERSGTASLGTLSALLDAYRRQFNIDAVLDLWPKIYEMGIELTNDRPRQESMNQARKGVSGPRGTILSVPLSIYIDALSSAGRHMDIAAVWAQFRDNGFVFDSHNWNHLVVALVRAGQPERAYEVVERIIIPFQELSASASIDERRDRNPSSPLLSDLPLSSNPDVIEETPGEPPLHGLAKRIVASKIATSRTSKMEGWDPDGDPEGEDFAYHLYILHRISPSWTTWRPHNAALTMLLVAYSRLSAGMLIKPFSPDGSADYTHGGDDEQSEARAIFRRIHENYPKTVNAVLDFESYEKQRLGDNFDERYNWS